MADDPTAAKWWPKFDDGACSLCGAVVGTRERDRGNHQLFHGMIWRLVIGDRNAINEAQETELRGWLRAMENDPRARG